jgi:hypothetical protein
MDENIYFFNLPLIKYGEVNATIREIQDDPRRFFEVDLPQIRFQPSADR